MTSQEFLELSTKLFRDLRRWIEEAGKHDGLSPSDLALLTSATNIVERVTLRETELKPKTAIE
jgi:hypothetical protein